MSNVPSLVGRSQWRSSFSYFLVTVGAIVGLGNFVYFPYFMIKYGGLFLFFFILSEILISIPLMMAELMIGRRGRQNPVGSIGIVCTESNANHHWRKLGWLSFFFTLLVIIYYTVSAAYPIHSLFKLLYPSSFKETLDVAALFEETISWSSFLVLEITFIGFLTAASIVVIRGINRGLEGISYIVVPVYSILILVTAILACIYGNLHQAIAQLFYFDLNAPLLPVILTAITFALFNLNVGMGSMIVYGSYLPYSTTIFQSSLYIIIFDFITSLLAYFTIAPVFYLTSPVNGTYLTDTTVVNLFSNHSSALLILGAFYFIATVVAAWTPIIAMFETLVITLTERFDLGRPRTVVGLALFIAFFGSYLIYSLTFSENLLIKVDDYKIAIKFFSENILGPIAALLVALFAGWGMAKHIPIAELKIKIIGNKIWRFCIAWLSPVIILMTTLMNL